MRLRALGLALAMAMAMPMAAQAQTAEGCTTISADAERLKCYDRALRPAPREAVPEDLGTWQIRTEKSKLADTDDVFGWMLSENTVPDTLGFRSARVRMSARCYENTTAIMWDFPAFLTTQTMRVEYRFDATPARSGWWQTSTDFKSVGLWSGAGAIPFLRELASSRTLILRLTPHGSNSLIVEFRLHGAAAVVAAIRKACKW